jgi:hypothetical protein
MLTLDYLAMIMLRLLEQNSASAIWKASYVMGDTRTNTSARMANGFALGPTSFATMSKLEARLMSHERINQIQEIKLDDLFGQFDSPSLDASLERVTVEVLLNV